MDTRAWAECQNVGVLAARIPILQPLCTDTVHCNSSCCTKQFFFLTVNCKGLKIAHKHELSYCHFNPLLVHCAHDPWVTITAFKVYTCNSCQLRAGPRPQGRSRAGGMLELTQAPYLRLRLCRHLNFRW